MKTKQKCALATLSLSLLLSSGWIIPESAHANVACEETVEADPKPVEVPAPEEPRRSSAGDDRWMSFTNRNSR